MQKITHNFYLTILNKNHWIRYTWKPVWNKLSYKYLKPLCECLGFNRIKKFASEKLLHTIKDIQREIQNWIELNINKDLWLKRYLAQQQESEIAIVEKVA